VAARRSFFERIEYGFVLVALLVLTESFIPLLIAGSANDASLTESNPLSLLSAVAIYSVALLYLVQRPYNTLSVIGNNTLLVVLFSLPLLSSFWSDDPMVTGRRAIALALTGILCVYFATRLSPDEFLRRLLLALFIGGVASLALGIAMPGMAVGQSEVNYGAWHGVYGHKAILGRIAAIAVVVTVYVRPKYRWEQVMRWLTLAIFLFLSYASESRASWLLILAVVGFMPVIAILRSRRLSGHFKAGIAIFLVVALVGGAVLGFQQVVEMMGRDATFSGRTVLWQGAIAAAMEQHPVIGAGYRAFWTESGAGSIRNFAHWGTLPDHGHNGYLDIWLELGVAGFVLFVAFILVTTARLLRRLFSAPGEKAWAAMFALLIIFLLNNASASVAFRHTDIAWAFVVLTALYAKGAAAASVPVIGRIRRRSNPLSTVPLAPGFAMRGAP